MSFGELVFTSLPAKSGRKSQLPGSGGGGAASPSGPSPLHEELHCTWQSFTDDLSARARVPRTPPSRHPSVYVNQLCRVVTQDTARCCYLDAHSNRIVVMLQTGMLQVSCLSSKCCTQVDSDLISFAMHCSLA